MFDFFKFGFWSVCGGGGWGKGGWFVLVERVGVEVGGFVIFGLVIWFFIFEVVFMCIRVWMVCGC